LTNRRGLGFRRLWARVDHFGGRVDHFRARVYDVGGAANCGGFDGGFGWWVWRRSFSRACLDITFVIAGPGEKNSLVGDPIYINTHCD
jgi:hypothetical protein